MAAGQCHRVLASSWHSSSVPPFASLTLLLPFHVKTTAAAPTNQTTTGKKEALANVGGLLCCNDDMLYEQLRNLTIVVEGYPT